MGIEWIVGLLTRYIQDPKQREEAIAAARAAYTKFLEYTSGPLYQIYRFLVMSLSMLDLLVFGGSYGARTADNLGISRAVFGLIELSIGLWPFAGEDIIKPVIRAVALAFEKASAGQKPAGKPDPESEERWKRIDKLMGDLEKK